MCLLRTRSQGVQDPLLPGPIRGQCKGVGPEVVGRDVTCFTLLTPGPSSVLHGVQGVGRPVAPRRLGVGFRAKGREGRGVRVRSGDVTGGSAPEVPWTVTGSVRRGPDSPLVLAVPSRDSGLSHS